MEASPDRELPVHGAETFPQTLACGLAFEGACLFMTILVNLPWERYHPFGPQLELMMMQEM